FERLVEELSPQRDLARSPLFQVKLAMQNAPRGGWEVAGLEVRPLRIDRGTSKLDLSVEVSEEAGRLRVTAEYDTELYGEETIRGWVEAWLELMERTEAGVRVRELIGPGERERRLLQDWNQTGKGVRWRELVEAIAVQAEVEGD